ncbi:hypothetical protein BKA66DRAFT_228955 [Pyrenochaeta sp. MPI-SDFR-AT-0127]|nr:hypothetical protein BKA66DRAFT_228955 [Pyrenochaeta sp. MPI-SDFR-AT-0127]
MGSLTPMAPQYQILRIPTSSPHLSDLITKFRDTKLEALKCSPSEWIYQYASESGHPLSVWKARLARQNTILVCVATQDTSLSAEDALLQGEWVGFAVVRGPFAFEDYYAVPEMEQPVPEDPDVETRWHIYDLYTFPAHRGRGIATKLGAAGMAAVGEITAALSDKTKQRARVRLFCNPKNTALVDTYKRLGFEQSGRVTLKEGLEANGMAESIPARDAMSSEHFKRVFDTRIGIAMERVIDIAHKL